MKLLKYGRWLESHDDAEGTLLKDLQPFVTRGLTLKDEMKVIFI